MHLCFVPRADSYADQLKRYGKTQGRQKRRAAQKATFGGPLKRAIATTDQEIAHLCGVVIGLHQKM